jgi:hypothetical protein
VAGTADQRPILFVMEVIARLQDRALCASITCITGILPSPKGGVIFDHRHNADVSELSSRMLMHG